MSIAESNACAHLVLNKDEALNYPDIALSACEAAKDMKKRGHVTSFLWLILLFVMLVARNVVVGCMSFERRGGGEGLDRGNLLTASYCSTTPRFLNT